MKKEILFITSEPESLSASECSQEYDILEGLRVSSYFRENFNISVLPNSTTDALADRIKQLSPNFIHYCGHGNKDGEFILLGHDKVVPFRTGTISRYLDRIKRLDCVLFCNCNSSELVNEILAYTEYAIGFQGTVKNEAMHKFVKEFYTDLFNSGSISNAFWESYIKIKTRIQQDSFPILRTKFNEFMKNVIEQKLSAAEASILASKEKIKVSDQFLIQVEQEIASATQIYQKDFREILLTHTTPEDLLWFHDTKYLLAGKVSKIVFKRKHEDEIDNLEKELKILFLAIETALSYFPDEQLIRENINASIEGSHIPVDTFSVALEELEDLTDSFPLSKDFRLLFKKVIAQAKSILLISLQ